MGSPSSGAGDNPGLAPVEAVPVAGGGFVGIAPMGEGIPMGLVGVPGTGSGVPGYPPGVTITDGKNANGTNPLVPVGGFNTANPASPDVIRAGDSAAPAVPGSTNDAAKPVTDASAISDKPPTLTPDFSSSRDQANLIIKSTTDANGEKTISHDWTGKAIENGQLKVFVENDISQQDLHSELGKAAEDIAAGKVQGISQNSTLNIPEVSQLPDKSKPTDGSNADPDDSGDKDGDMGYGNGGGGGGGNCDGGGGGGGGGNCDGGGDDGGGSEGGSDTADDTAPIVHSGGRALDEVRSHVMAQGLNPYTNTYFGQRMMTPAIASLYAGADLNGDGKIDEEEMAALNEKLAKLKSEHPEEFENLEKNAKDMTNGMDPTKDKADIDAINGFAKNLAAPNKDFANDLLGALGKHNAGTLAADDLKGNKAFTPELQKAIANRAITDVVRDSNFTEFGLNKTAPTDKDKLAKYNSEEASVIGILRKQAYTFGIGTNK